MTSEIRPFALVVTISIGLFLSACQSETQESSAARKALDDLQQKYDELVEDNMEDPVQWAADGFLAVLKKPSISYLSKIPLSQLGKFVIGAPANEE